MVQPQPYLVRALASTKFCCDSFPDLAIQTLQDIITNIWNRWRPYRVECTGSLPTSEVKRRRARLVLGWGTAREDLRVLLAFSNCLCSNLHVYRSCAAQKVVAGFCVLGPIPTTGFFLIFVRFSYTTHRVFTDFRVFFLYQPQGFY